MRLTLPTTRDLSELTRHRDDASVSIYLKSSPLPNQLEATELALKSMMLDAQAQLRGIGTDPARIDEINRAMGTLQADREFWEHQTASLAIFVAPGSLHAYRLASSLHPKLAIGDRFDIAPLLRSVAFPQGGYVLSITEGVIRLLQLSADQRPRELPLSLPDDLHTVLEQTPYEGRFDRNRAGGALGEKTEQHRYCRLVQAAVLDAIEDSTLPLILAASHELEPAYRSINTYDHLLEQGITAHPGALTIDELDARARAILDEHYAAQLSAWRDRFGTLRSKNLATSRLDEVSRAATAAAVAELLFDMDFELEGSIDDAGVLHAAADPSAKTYGIVDEIAARVFNSAGTVTAARAADLVDGSPVAAVLRFPV